MTYIIIIFNKQSLFQRFQEMDQTNYQRMVLEIQQLKKAVNNQKLAHEATLNQLQASYDLNQELQSISQTQSKNITSLNKTLANRNAKIQELSGIYETQIMELKELINAKDHQLTNIRASLMITDYDVIRLRVINELQLAHKEQIESLQTELRRANVLYQQEKQGRLTAEQKIAILKGQLIKQGEEYEYKLEQRDRKMHRQVNKMHEQLQKQKCLRRDKEKLIEMGHKKYNSMVEKFENDLAIAYASNNRAIQNKSNFHDDSTKNNELRNEIARWEADYMELKKKGQRQEGRYKRKIQELQRKQAEQKNEGISYEQHMEKMKKKDDQISELIQMNDKKIRKMRVQYDEQISKIRRQQAQTPKQNYMRDSNNQHYNSQNLLEQGLYQIKKAYQAKAARLEGQNQKLKDQLSQKKDNAKQTPKTGNVEIYKAKLTEANRQIVNLLQQKVSLKQEIAKLKKK